MSFHQGIRGGMGGESLSLTDSGTIDLHPHTRFVVPFHRYEANKMCGDWTVQVVFHQFVSVGVSIELLKEKEKLYNK